MKSTRLEIECLKDAILSELLTKINNGTQIGISLDEQLIEKTQQSNSVVNKREHVKQLGMLREDIFENNTNMVELTNKKSYFLDHYIDIIETFLSSEENQEQHIYDEREAAMIMTEKIIEQIEHDKVYTERFNTESTRYNALEKNIRMIETIPYKDTKKIKVDTDVERQMLKREYYKRQPSDRPTHSIVDIFVVDETSNFEKFLELELLPETGGEKELMELNKEENKERFNQHRKDFMLIDNFIKSHPTYFEERIRTKESFFFGIADVLNIEKEDLFGVSEEFRTEDNILIGYFFLNNYQHQFFVKEDSDKTYSNNSLKEPRLVDANRKAKIQEQITHVSMNTQGIYALNKMTATIMKQYDNINEALKNGENLEEKTETVENEEHNVPTNEEVTEHNVEENNDEYMEDYSQGYSPEFPSSYSQEENEEQNTEENLNQQYEKHDETHENHETTEETGVNHGGGIIEAPIPEEADLPDEHEATEERDLEEIENFVAPTPEEVKEDNSFDDPFGSIVAESLPMNNAHHVEVNKTVENNDTQEETVEVETQKTEETTEINSNEVNENEEMIELLELENVLVSIDKEVFYVLADEKRNVIGIPSCNVYMIQGKRYFDLTEETYKIFTIRKKADGNNTYSNPKNNKADVEFLKKSYTVAKIPATNIEKYRIG